MRTVLPLERNPITLDDLRAMFKLFSGADGHKREAGDIDVWMIAANAARWTRAEVAAASLTIAATWTGFRIMPGHVTEQIAADRERIRKVWYCPDPPRHLGSDPAAEIAWRRQAHADFADRALLAIATGGQLADVPMVCEVEPYQVSVLPTADGVRRVEQATERVAARKAIPAERSQSARTATGQPLWGDLDAEGRRAVRAELDARTASAASDETRGAVRAESDARAAASTGKSGLDESSSSGFDHEVTV